MYSKLRSGHRQRAPACQSGGSLYVVDAATNASYVLIPAADYQRIRALFEADDVSIRETYLLQEAVARAAGWDDPAMDTY